MTILIINLLRIKHIGKGIHVRRNKRQNKKNSCRPFRNEEEKVTEEASFIDDLGADSLDTVELVMAFEEEFGSEISDSEAEKILTVGDAIKFIESKSS